VFHPDLALYKTKDQPSFRDREGTYKVPASLHGIITAVLGFGERRVAQRKPARVKKKVAHPNSPFTPADIESHYHFPPGDAAGQTIAIAEFGGGYFTSDLTDYCRKFNRPVPKVKTVSIDKVPIRNRAQIARLPVNAKSELDNTGEVMMDVQIVAGLCPAAKLSVYFAKDSQKGWVDLLDQVIREKPAALSISWGAAEDSSGWSKAARNALNDRLNVAAALGITVACAAGDDGSGDMQSTKGAHVDFPSSSPFVLAVGGTMITRKDKKFTEQVWRVGKGRRVNGRGGATRGRGQHAL
jgi:kumamolisin